MNLRQNYIRLVFVNFKQLKISGIWFSGIKEKGEFIAYHENGKIEVHGKVPGEWKRWSKNGDLFQHYYVTKDNAVIGQYKEYWGGGISSKTEWYKKDGEYYNYDEIPYKIEEKFKDGFIYVNGKYYPDEGDIQ